MTLADTSAWIEFLRRTDSRASQKLRELIADDEPIVTTEVIVMELLAGARTDREVGAVHRLASALELSPIDGLRDYERAAELYRTCRRGGETIRKLTDCLIAAVAIRVGVPVLHRERDFDVLARHTALRVEPS